jgi:DNA (cytosine-5)-methyltransferase 3A
MINGKVIKMEKSNAVYGSEGEVVLSCFDGISCSQVALRKLGIKVSTYYASEVDKHAIKITQSNFPFTVQLGDIRKVHVNDHIDILLGGPPCQDVSLAGKGKGLIDGERSSLFFEFVRVLREAKAINPDLKFLVENTRMKQEYVDIISEILGVEPVLINSKVFSAQNRARLYWTNFDIPELPESKNIVMADILEDEVCSKYLVGQQLLVNYSGGDQLNPNYKSQANTIHDHTKKSPTVCAGTHGYAIGYVDANHFKYGDMSEILVGTHSKDGLYHVGNADINGHDVIKRVYHRDGKAPCLNTMSGGNRHPKVYVGGMKYRRLTPLECERLQCLPDGYTEGVSDTQRYKGIGNGWTVDVICHIMSELKQKGLNNV